MPTVLHTSVVAEMTIRRAWSSITSSLPAPTEEGEGVISLAIAVLIMAVIGAAMFLVFQGIANDSGDAAKTKVATIK